ncbi:MAG: hypothetical protein K0S58_3453, partial [Nitrospira sp.]|nr:hypothetical protein [Nitrospira sp.]
DIASSAYRLAPNPDGTLYVTNFERLDVSVVGSQILYRLNADGSRVSGFSPVNVYTVGFNARIYALARVADDTNDVLIGGGFVLDSSGTVNPLLDPTAIGRSSARTRLIRQLSAPSRKRLMEAATLFSRPAESAVSGLTGRPYLDFRSARPTALMTLTSSYVCWMGIRSWGVPSPHTTGPAGGIS